MHFYSVPFKYIMSFCYNLCNNYFLAIVLFTFLSKIILLPISIIVQYNSIKIVKMQPELNFIKVKFYGDKDKISEEQIKTYKKYHYNVFISILPLVFQLVILMAVIEVIKYGMSGLDVTETIFGVSLMAIPSKSPQTLFLVPILAALSALIMCVCQNASNVLQQEQEKWSQWGMLVISVALSFYLGFFVEVGVAVYWIFSNLFAILQLYLLNFFINPKKYVDYEQLEKSKKELDELNKIGSDNKRNPDYRINRKKEKTDCKRFASVVNKHLVFYSESSGFFKYYSGIIDYLLEKTNLTIHYVTSDPQDTIFDRACSNNRIRAYYIGEKKLITFMMKMDADVVVMTMPDLDSFHIKRSYIRSDIEYLYVPHGMDSLNMTMREHSMDSYDSVLCATRSQEEEIRAIEKEYKIKEKKIIECGYPLLDDMLSAYKSFTEKNHQSDTKMVLIAPSWQPDNIVDSCLEEMLDFLKKTNYRIVVRPHPQHIKHRKEQMERLKEKYMNNNNIEVQLDFSDSEIVWRADLLITDWSGIAYEYFCCTKRPVLFINTPMKVMNQAYQRIDVVPSNIQIREIVGKSLEIDEIDNLLEIVDYLISNHLEYEKAIDGYLKEQLFHIGDSAAIAGKYIAESIINKQNSYKNGGKNKNE